MKLYDRHPHQRKVSGGVSSCVFSTLLFLWKLYWYISSLKRFGWCWNVSRRKVTSRSPSWSQPCLGWGVPTSHPPLSGLQILTEKDEGEKRTMRTNWHLATSKSGTMGGPLGIFTILTISLQGEVLIFFLFVSSPCFLGILDLSSKIASFYSGIET